MQLLSVVPSWSGVGVALGIPSPAYQLGTAVQEAGPPLSVTALCLALPVCLSPM